WSKVRRANQAAQSGWLPSEQLARSEAMPAAKIAAMSAAAVAPPPVATAPVRSVAATTTPSAITAPVPPAVRPRSAAAQPVAQSVSQAAAPSPHLLLQVLVPRAAMHAKPDTAAPVVAQIEIGAELEADSIVGDWYRVRRPTGGEAWIQDAPTATGMTLAVARFPPGKRLGYETARLDVPANTPAQSRQTQLTLERTRPQGVPIEPQLAVIDPKQVPPPSALNVCDAAAMPDRWRVLQSLGLLPYERGDPYNPNAMKGDLPVLQDRLGPDWFVNLNATSDTLLEIRRLPGAGAGGAFGDCRQVLLTETGVLGLSLIKGDTAFRPPDYQFRFTPAASVNRMVSNRASGGLGTACTGRSDQFVGAQELFADKRLRVVSERYDFDSVRAGVQPFTADFRGLLFVDQALGARLYGTRAGNLWQYNVGLFRRIEKDTNTGLNDLTKRLRADDVLAFNIYRQDWPVNGFTTQGVILHNRNREGSSGEFRDSNGVVQRPAAGNAAARDYDVTYVGVNGDGHFGRWNVSASAYHARGRNTMVASKQREEIRAFFGALELSRDFSWIRVRASAMYASGDRNPNDDKATGYDAVLERPLIAGADTSYWIHQSLPLVAGGQSLNMRNGVLPSMRTSRESGQSNFANPGLRLIGVGADFDVTPRLRLISNLNYLTFDDMAALAAFRNQAFTSKAIGTDISFGMHYRPALTQNVVVNASVAALIPGQGLKELYGDAADAMLYSMLLNLLLTF
ncbi:MAG: SH3 domain-containing protein, partial [Betaproteobacteria bacterium]